MSGMRRLAVPGRDEEQNIGRGLDEELKQKLLQGQERSQPERLSATYS